MAKIIIKQNLGFQKYENTCLKEEDDDDGKSHQLQAPISKISKISSSQAWSPLEVALGWRGKEREGKWEMRVKEWENE